MLDPTPLIVVSTVCAIISLCSGIAGIVKGKDTKSSNIYSDKIDIESDSLSKLLTLLEKLDSSDLLHRIEQIEKSKTIKESQDV